MRSLFLLLAIILISLNNVNAQESLDDFWPQYISSYTNYLNTKTDPDIKMVLQHFNEPLMQMPSQGEPRVSLKREVLENGFTRFLEKLKNKGVTKMEWEKLQVVSLSQNTALASNIARGLDANGNVVERLASIYMLSNSSDGWKIAVIKPISLDNVPVLK